MDQKTQRLFEAVRAEDVQTVRSLIAEGVDVNAEEKPGIRAIDLLPYGNFSKSAVINNLLVGAGAEVISKGPAVLGAVARKDVDPNELRLLIESGEDINAQNGIGITALMYAAKWKPELVKQLIDAGADLDIRDNDGRTALMYLLTPEDYFERVNPETVALLIDAGSDVNAKDNAGNSPLTKISLFAHPWDVFGRLLPLVKKKLRGDAVDLTSAVRDFYENPPPLPEPRHREPAGETDKQDDWSFIEDALREDEELIRFDNEPGYLPIHYQFKKFLNDKLAVSSREFEVDDSDGPEVFIYDEHKDLDGNLDLVDLFDLIFERLNRYFKTSTVSEAEELLRKVLRREIKSTGPYGVYTYGLDKILIMRGNKILEMRSVDQQPGQMGKARLSYFDKSYLPKIKEKIRKNPRSRLVRYRDIPR